MGTDDDAVVGTVEVCGTVDEENTPLHAARDVPPGDQEGATLVKKSELLSLRNGFHFVEPHRKSKVPYARGVPHLLDEIGQELLQLGISPALLSPILVRGNHPDAIEDGLDAYRGELPDHPSEARFGLVVVGPLKLGGKESTNVPPHPEELLFGIFPILQFFCLELRDQLIEPRRLLVLGGRAGKGAVGGTRQKQEQEGYEVFHETWMGVYRSRRVLATGVYRLPDTTPSVDTNGIDRPRATIQNQIAEIMKNTIFSNTDPQRCPAKRAAGSLSPIGSDVMPDSRTVILLSIC